MDIYNASRTLPASELRSFRKTPRRLVLLPGEQLFRFASIVSPTFKGNDAFGSPWWIPASTYRNISKTAKRTGKPVARVARSVLAIATPWNPTMEWFMVIELKQAVYAWIGPTRSQPLDGEDSAVLLKGGFDQAYVPGLSPEEALASDAAVLMYYGQPYW